MSDKWVAASVALESADEIERLTAQLKATEANEQILVDANKPLLVRIAGLKAENERLLAAQSLVDEQAENDGLWFIAKYATEAYLQSELRRLHEVIEGKSSDECAHAALAAKEKP